MQTCTKAAEGGDHFAQTTLGEIYDELGNAEQTAHWWNQAANAGYQPARNLLALKYYYGGTVTEPQEAWPQNYEKAFKIWMQDADNGVATAEFMIGVM